MQHLLYEVPMPQAQFIDLSESSLLFFFNYESRYLLKSFNSELMNDLTLVYLGHDFFPIQQWAKAENFDVPIRWSGPDGLNSSLCLYLEITTLPIFLAFKNSQVVYCSKDWPNSRFLQDFKSGEVKSLMHEFISSILQDLVDNVSLICGSDFEVPKLHEKSYADSIILLQSEILNYQGLCKQQQLVIEALREELSSKTKQLSTLNEIVNKQSVMNEKLNIVQNTIQYEKKLQLHSNLVAASKPQLYDNDFWKVNEDEYEKDSKFEDLLGSGLWISKLETQKMATAASMPVLPKTKPQLAPIEKKTMGKSKLEIQQERQMKILQEKQPIGRDGKRIPLPKVRKNVKNTTGTSISMLKSSEFRI